jgi:hypothetical protein
MRADPKFVLKFVRSRVDKHRKGVRTMRKPADTARTVVRLSVPVDVLTHARLRALASLRQVDASAIAANILRVGLRNVLVRDVGTDAGEPAEPAAS